jgi:hypothetical protein
MIQQIDSSPDWTKACLVDHLKHHLATVESVDGKYDNRRYYNQAHDMLKIGRFKPAPYFIVYLSDLSPRLIKELYDLDNEDRNFVLKQAVGRIFEDVNPEIYHNSVSQMLKVKLE